MNFGKGSDMDNARQMWKIDKKKPKEIQDVGCFR